MEWRKCLYLMHQSSCGNQIISISKETFQILFTRVQCMHGELRNKRLGDVEIPLMCAVILLHWCQQLGLRSGFIALGRTVAFVVCRHHPCWNPRKRSQEMTGLGILQLRWRSLCPIWLWGSWLSRNTLTANWKCFVPYLVGSPSSAGAIITAWVYLGM
jgi:hypothetical protein